MRISPLWLLVCGLTFVSVIVLSNQFAKPAEQRQSLAANFPAPSNTATNQALSQPLATAPMNSATTSVQEVSQPPAPAPLEVKNETTVVGEKAETQDEPQPDAPPSSAPVVETKSEPVIPAPQGDSQKADGLTIQVGSYNVIEQANERAARLQSAGFDARVAAVELPKRGMWYRVYAGRFDSRQEAARYGNELRAKGAADNFIITEIQSGK